MGRIDVRYGAERRKWSAKMPMMRPALLLFDFKDEGRDQWVERRTCGTSVGRPAWTVTNGRKSAANAHCDAAGKASCPRC